MELFFINYPAILFINSNPEWLNQILTIMISTVALCISLLTLILTQLKMNKSEQIKILHDIQSRYSTAFERYKEEVVDRREGRSDDLPEFLSYTELLNVLEWHAFLRERKQISREFDSILETYYRAVHFVFLEYRDRLLPNSYPGVRRMWDFLNLN